MDTPENEKGQYCTGTNETIQYLTVLLAVLYCIITSYYILSGIVTFRILNNPY